MAVIAVSIPGRSELIIHHVVFDFNGTLATDGKLSAETIELIDRLKREVQVHIITSDTYGTARAACQDLGVDLVTLSTDRAAEQKKSHVEQYGASTTCSIGNGANDVLMFQTSALAIMVIGHEGGATKALQSADIVVTSIESAIELLLMPHRIVAALRD